MIEKVQWSPKKLIVEFSVEIFLFIMLTQCKNETFKLC